MTRPGIETRSPEPLANTLIIWPMSKQILKIHNKIASTGLGDRKETVNYIGEWNKLTLKEYKDIHKKG